jgi:DNA invertase Pin-like site-specific DNA recombinase
MLIGYARVSTVQVVALKAAGCERIYREKAFGGRRDRLELQGDLDHLRKGMWLWLGNSTGSRVRFGAS